MHAGPGRDVPERHRRLGHWQSRSALQPSGNLAPADSRQRIHHACYRRIASRAISPASRRGAVLPGLRSEERATREGDAFRRPGGEREIQQRRSGRARYFIGALAPCDHGGMRIGSTIPTNLFVGTPRRPLQIVRVTLVNDPPGVSGPIIVRVEGAGVATPIPFGISGVVPGAQAEAEVPVSIAAPHVPGSRLPVTVIAETATRRCEAEAEITVAEPGWTMWMVSHFHYDPVWWNTQGQFTEARLLLPGEDGELPEVRTAFELVRLHLDAARHDPDYKFVLAEIDYLKPYLDAHPEDRADLFRLVAEGRIEIVGGSYNEPNTNLTAAESTIRNAVHGLGYQRDVIGGDIRATWMLDAFGHDPGYPGLMAAAGLTESAWARGPFHQWGPLRTVGDNQRMQFPSEFEWVSPDGGGLLTSYMPNHYGAGWAMHHAADLAGAEAEALAQFELLAPVAATRNVLLPVGADHVIPCRWATAIHRDWNARYVWPRFVTALPREFFSAVRADAARRDIWLTPQTRDMNPVYPDLLGGWREAYERGDRARIDAAAHLARLADTRPAQPSDKPLRAVAVFNTLSWPRSGMATITLAFGAPGPAWLALRDQSGSDVAFLADGVRRHLDGTLAEVSLTFRAARSAGSPTSARVRNSSVAGVMSSCSKKSTTTTPDGARGRGSCPPKALARARPAPAPRSPRSAARSAAGWSPSSASAICASPRRRCSGTGRTGSRSAPTWMARSARTGCCGRGSRPACPAGCPCTRAPRR